MKKKSRVLVLGINCLPELTGIGKYTGEMVSWLAQNGHETVVITGFPYYPDWKIHKPYSGKFFKKEFYHRGMLSIFRCPMYVPNNPTGIKRVVHEAVFFFSAFLAVLRLIISRTPYDYIFAIAPPFHIGFLALFYRFFRGGKIVYHIQDLQVDAAKELNMLPKAVFPLLFWLERTILAKVDFVSTISDGMIDKVKAKVKKDVLFFPNWVDTERFYPISTRDSLKAHWGFKENDKIVLYSGSVGEKQGLDLLLDIADELREVEMIKFVICGTGPYKKNLVAEAERMNLKNVFFLPLQDHEVFNNFLNIADVHLVLQKGDASDLVMPSKLTTILSVGGLALVTANENTSLYRVIMEHNMGLVVPAENKNELQKSILISCTRDNIEYKENARRYAEKYLKMDNILMDVLEKTS